MPGIDRIYQKIIEDAQAEGKSLVDKASLERDQSFNAQQLQLDSYQEKQLEAAKVEGENILRRSQANRNLEGKKQILSVKQDLITQAFDKAYEKMMKLEGKKVLDLYISLIKSCLNEGENEIILSQQDKLDMGQDILAYFDNNPIENTKVLLSSTHISEDRGVIVRNGKIYSNSTFSTLLKYKKSDLDVDVMNILFEGSKAD